ncbi:hypothetical protein U1Q18_025358, partial [Sarracenia purpurea var. burkii]
ENGKLRKVVFKILGEFSLRHFTFHFQISSPVVVETLAVAGPCRNPSRCRRPVRRRRADRVQPSSSSRSSSSSPSNQVPVRRRLHHARSSNQDLEPSSSSSASKISNQDLPVRRRRRFEPRSRTSRALSRSSSSPVRLLPLANEDFSIFGRKNLNPRPRFFWIDD